MRILFIGNAGRKYMGQRFYNMDNKIHNGLVRNGCNVLFFSDRDELGRLASFSLKPLASRRIQSSLLHNFESFKPDAVFFLNGNTILPQTLRDLRMRFPGVPFAEIIVDAIFNPNNRKKWHDYEDCFDMRFFTTAGDGLLPFSSAACKCYFMPNITDRSIETGQAFTLDAPDYDVFCAVMHSREAQKSRGFIPQYIQDNAPDLKYCYYGVNRAETLRGQGYYDLLSRAAIALNLSQNQSGGGMATPETRYLYSSDRIGQLTGCGVMTMTSDEFSLDELWSHDEMVFFSSKEDALDKVRFYTDNAGERRRIAENGWKKAHGAFNETVVARYLLDRVFNRNLGMDYAWPTNAVSPPASQEKTA